MSDNEFILIGPINQVVTMTNMPLKGSLKDEQLTIIENGGLLIKNGVIEEVRKYGDLKERVKSINPKSIKPENEVVCLPGFIDSHTHICFAGSRAKDYALRNAGSTYMEIARSGGGIWDTVTKTRKATSEELFQSLEKRIHAHVSKGITTIEVKSGYGLSVSEELKMLEVIAEAHLLLPADLVSTCLAAHLHPKDFRGSEEEYLEHLIELLLPRLKDSLLTNRIDAFIEEGAFSPKMIHPYFKKAKELGFDITVHADQFSTGGSALAVEYGAISADHLEASTKKEIELLANNDIVATALPGASIGLGCNHAPARELLDAGAILAIASDWNPGSAPMGDLVTQAAILGSAQKLSNAEVLAAITYRAAHALRLDDRGTLQKGNKADFNLFPTSDYQEILYHQGQLRPMEVWKSGRNIFHA